MYKLLVLLLVVFFLTEPARHTVTQRKEGNDTLFLLRKKTHESYYKVYIEKNRQSASYKNLLDFSMESYDADTYREYLKDLKHRHTRGLKRYDLTGLPKQWMPVYRYKNRYYIYSPSEWVI